MGSQSRFTGTSIQLPSDTWGASRIDSKFSGSVTPDAVGNKDFANNRFINTESLEFDNGESGTHPLTATSGRNQTGLNSYINKSISKNIPLDGGKNRSRMQ